MVTRKNSCSLFQISGKNTNYNKLGVTGSFIYGYTSAADYAAMILSG